MAIKSPLARKAFGYLGGIALKVLRNTIDWKAVYCDPTVDLGHQPWAKVERLGMDGEPAGVDPRRVEQLGDQPGDPVGVGVDGREHQPLLVVAEALPGETLHVEG